jgi:hypothetical protein
MGRGGGIGLAVAVAAAAAAAAAPACFGGGAQPGDAGPGDGASETTGGVADLLASSCAVSGCHVGPSAPLHLDLSPGAYYASLVGVPSQEAAGTLRVAPGFASDTRSWLLCKVDPECQVIGGHMPLGSGGLDAASIALLRAWIASLPPDDAGPPPGGVDVTPPVFAGAATAIAGPSSITLGWPAAVDETTAAADIDYLIYEGAAPGAEDFGTPVATTPRSATSWAVGPLAPSTTFYFVVRARDLADNIDDNVVEVSATTPATVDSAPPTFAGATGATAKSAGTVTLSWSPASDDWSAAAAITYRAYSATTSGGEAFQTPDAVTLPGATSVDVTGLAGGALHYFVVRASDQAGNVDANVVEVTAQTPAVGFTSDVWPLFSEACTSAGCHAGPAAAEGIDLSSAAAAHATLVGVPSAECSSLAVVQPSQPAASFLLQKLRGYGSCFAGWQMPVQTTPLTGTQIDLVSAWIASGAPLN